jgi:hypothetical protein
LLSLTTLSNGQPLTEKAATGYLASLSELTKEQLSQAFSRALDEARFLPVPATLLELAGATAGDVVPAETREELFRIALAKEAAALVDDGVAVARRVSSNCAGGSGGEANSRRSCRDSEARESACGGAVASHS